MNPTILTCPPIDRDKQRELGIVAFAAGPDMVEGVCQKCGTKVWLGSRHREALRAMPDARVACFGCTMAQGKATMAHLGGQGGRYLVNRALIKKP